MFGWKCTSHVASNALKWWLSPNVQGDLLSDLHNSIAALRNSSDELLNMMD